VRDDATDLSGVMQILGPHWKVAYSDHPLVWIRVDIDTDAEKIDQLLTEKIPG
jgi:hypothetical protein